MVISKAFDQVIHSGLINL